MHELKKIIQQALLNQEKGIKNVLSSVVYLEGSSYIKLGVRILFSTNVSSIGAFRRVDLTSSPYICL